MTWDHPVAAAWLARRGPHVRARILRLNPEGPTPGKLLRGWQRKRTMGDHQMSGRISRGTFIWTYGRHAWEQVRTRRPDALGWDGRRCWVTRFFVVDYSEILADLRDGKIATFPGPACRVIRKRTLMRQTVILP